MARTRCRVERSAARSRSSQASASAWRLGGGTSEVTASEPCSTPLATSRARPGRGAVGELERLLGVAAGDHQHHLVEARSRSARMISSWARLARVSVGRMVFMLSWNLMRGATAAAAAVTAAQTTSTTQRMALAPGHDRGDAEAVHEELRLAVAAAVAVLAPGEHRREEEHDRHHAEQDAGADQDAHLPQAAELGDAEGVEGGRGGHRADHHRPARRARHAAQRLGDAAARVALLDVAGVGDDDEVDRVR